MKNITFYLLTLCCLLFPAACFGSGETDGTTTPMNNPSALIRVADPTVVVWQGKYYLTGTSGDSSKGFTLLESTDMTHWTTAGQALTKGDQTFGTKGFWAPQIVKWGDNKWVMAYTANEQVAIAWADKLSGPYRQTTVGAWDDTENNIDPFIFRDDDGQCYLYHVRFNNGNYIWVARVDKTTLAIDRSSLRQCLQCTEKWENTGAYPSSPIMEGPTVIKHGSKYYLFYSANHFMSPDYSVGYAVADSPLGPWTKAKDSPIISRNIVGENGSGHGDFFLDDSGNPWYVYHVHASSSKATPRQTRFVRLKFESSDLGYDKVTADPSTVVKPVIVSQ